jgi:hypothetical protein
MGRKKSLGFKAALMGLPFTHQLFAFSFLVGLLSAVFYYHSITLEYGIYTKNWSI